MDEGSIVRVLEALGATKIRRTGAMVSSSCPMAPWRHTKGTDRNPSFGMAINPSGPSWFKCQACKASGKKAISLIIAFEEASGGKRHDLKDMVRDVEGGSIRERHERLGDFEQLRRAKMRRHSESFWKVPGYERAFAEEDFAHMLKAIPQYAIERGITTRQAKRWGLGYDQKWERLFISIRDETGKLVGFSARAINEDQTPKYLHAKDMAREKYLYGEQFVDRKVKIGFLMEGFMDVLRLDRRGWKNMLACMGTEVSPKHIEKLQKWFACVVIFPHNDPEPPPRDDGRAPELPPGMKMAVAYRDALKEAGVNALIGPMIKGRKDPGEWSDSECAAVEQRLGRLFSDYGFSREEGRQAVPPREAEGGGDQGLGGAG